jgi:hypothetical protein
VLVSIKRDSEFMPVGLEKTREKQRVIGEILGQLLSGWRTRGFERLKGLERLE